MYAGLPALGLGHRRAGGGEVPTIPLTETFSAALDAGKWTATTTGNPGESCVASEGVLVATMPGTVANQKVELTSVNTFDLTGKAVYVKLVQPLRTPGDAAGSISFFKVWFSNGNELSWNLHSNGAVYAAYMQAFVVDELGIAFDLFGADANAYTWLRIREANGTIYWDTAPGTALNPPTSRYWTNRWSHAVSGLVITAGKVKLGVSTWNVGAGAATQPAKFDGVNTEAWGTNNIPSVVPAGWLEKYWRDYSAMNAISLNAGGSEPALVADSGEYKIGTMHWREGGQNDSDYIECGISGWAYDVYTDPLVQSLLPAEYLKERPLGEVEPIPGVGIRLHSRPTTGPDLDAVIATQFPEQVTKANGIGTDVWVTGYLASYRKISAKPPFARVTYFIPRNDFLDQHWYAALWSVADGNHAWPNDTLHLPFEYDDNEALGYGADQLSQSTSIHAFAAGGAPVLDTALGHYHTGSTVGHLVGVCTVFDTATIKTYYNLNGSAWTLVSTVDVATQLVGAEYDQHHMAFIHQSGNGVPWFNLAATVPLAIDIVKTGIFAPNTNLDLVLPAATPPDEVTLVMRSNPGVWTAGTVIADLTFPAGVVAASAIAYAGLLTVVGTEVRLAADLHPGTTPSITFHIQGVTAGGAKSIGRKHNYVLV